jgi:hypothetical protein
MLSEAMKSVIHPVCILQFCGMKIRVEGRSHLHDRDLSGHEVVTSEGKDDNFFFAGKRKKKNQIFAQFLPCVESSGTEVSIVSNTLACT